MWIAVGILTKLWKMIYICILIERASKALILDMSIRQFLKNQETIRQGYVSLKIDVYYDEYILLC